MTRVVHTISFLIILCAIPFTSYGSVPGAISYQGQLLNSLGIPISTTTTIAFTLWTAANGGTQIGAGVGSGGWIDEDTVTPDSNGFYSTAIGDDPGSSIPADAFVSSDLWLDISVNGTSLLPRTRLLTVPYAYHSSSADSSQTAQTAQSISGSSLSSPGDSVQLADNVILAVSDDGELEFNIDDQQYRLAKPEWGWTHPASESDTFSLDGSSASSPRVAMDNNGNAIIVWNQNDGSHRKVYKSEYRNGIWTHPSDLGDKIGFDGNNVLYNEVAMDDNGNAIIVWGQFGYLYKSEYRNGSWTHPASTSDYFCPSGQIAVLPSVAMNNGQAIIAWRQLASSSPVNNFMIYKSEYRNGSWLHPTDLSDHISDSGGVVNGYPLVAIDNYGNTIIVWHQKEGNISRVYKSEYRIGVPVSAWQHPTDLSDHISPYDSNSAYRPQVTMDDSGNAIVVWAQTDETLPQVFRSEFRAGVWAHPTAVTDNISPDDILDDNPQVAMGDNGDAVIVSSLANGEFTEYGVVKSERRNDSWVHHRGWVDNVSSFNRELGGTRFPVMSDTGDTVIVWQSYNNPDRNDERVYLAEYRNDRWSFPLGISDSINPYGSVVQNTRAAIDNSGNTIIVWSQFDGTISRVFKSEFRYGFK